MWYSTDPDKIKSRDETARVYNRSRIFNDDYCVPRQHDDGRAGCVIKVEPYEMGDPMRYLGAKRQMFPPCSPTVIGAKKPANRSEIRGQAVIRSMIADVDVVIHNFRLGVMDKLNLGSDALGAINQSLFMSRSRLVPRSARDVPAYDPIIQAHAGVTATQGRGDEPAFMRTLLCDKITGYTACQAVTAALFARERSGDDQHIDLSMIDSGLFFIFLDGLITLCSTTIMSASALLIGICMSPG